MDTAERKIANFWARLASIPSLEVSDDIKRRSLRDFENAAYYYVCRSISRQGPTRKSQLKRKRKLFFESGRNQYAFTETLPQVHKWVRNVIYQLLRGEEVEPESLKYPSVVWTVQNGQLCEKFSQQELRNVLLFELSRLLHERPFPFKLCTVCRHVFVPVKRQKYCSKECSYHGIEDARKEKRRPYMREYMREWRTTVRPCKD